MTRVFAIATHYRHIGARSGFARSLEYLSPDRFAVHLHAAADGDDDFPITHVALRGLLRRGVQRKGMTWYKLSDVVAEARAWRACFTRRADLVHYLDGEHSAQYLPLVRRWTGLRARILATFHQPPSLLAQLVRRDVVRRIDHVSIVSPSQAEFFEGVLPIERVHTVLHGIDTSYFVPPPVRPQRERLVCLTVGHWLRDFATLREIALRLADAPVEFHVVTHATTGLEELPNVTFHRGVSDAALLALYQGADVLLLPLTDCTANNALLEGMACGLPVVASDLAGVRAYADPPSARLVSGADADAFAHMLLALRDDDAARAGLGESARRRAEALDWARVTPGLAEVYERIGAST